MHKALFVIDVPSGHRMGESDLICQLLTTLRVRGGGFHPPSTFRVSAPNLEKRNENQRFGKPWPLMSKGVFPAPVLLMGIERIFFSMLRQPQPDSGCSG